MTNTKSQLLHEIAGVEDLNNENSAAVSGGVALLADKFDLGGRINRVTSTGNLRKLVNRASSIVVPAGNIWDFFTGINGKGRRIRVAGGKNGRVLNLVSGNIRFNNNIEFARRIK